MRIISGNAKGTILKTLKGTNTRPTLDRVKEALFNIIQFDIPNTKILDLFAGTGSLGIEALSRGAKETTFCDNSSEAIKIIEENLIKTKFEKKSKIIKKDYLNTLESLQDKFNIIFLDPPYKTDYVIKSLTKISEQDLLTKDGKIIIETNDEQKENDINKILKDKNKINLEIYDKRKYGTVILIFIRKGK